MDVIREYVRSGATFLAKPVEDGKWLTTGDPLSYLKAVLAYELDGDGIKEPLLSYMQGLLSERKAHGRSTT